MKKSKNARLVTAGFLAGIMIGAPTAQAAVEYLQAYPNRGEIYVDGQQVQLEAYTINGSNYIKLRDIGQAVGFNVYWADAVQIDTTQDYTGQAPKAESKMVTLPTDDTRYIPKVGDQIPCQMERPTPSPM